MMVPKKRHVPEETDYIGGTKTKIENAHVTILLYIMANVAQVFVNRPHLFLETNGYHLEHLL